MKVIQIQENENQVVRWFQKYLYFNLEIIKQNENKKGDLPRNVQQW